MGKSRLVCLVRLVCCKRKNFVFFFIYNGHKTNSHLHYEQTVNGFRKTPWAFIFRFPFETAPYSAINIRKIELTEKDNYHFLPQMENDKLPFVFCKRNLNPDVCFPWSANDNRRLLFHQRAHLWQYLWLVLNSIISGPVGPEPDPSRPEWTASGCN